MITNRKNYNFSAINRGYYSFIDMHIYLCNKKIYVIKNYEFNNVRAKYLC